MSFVMTPAEREDFLAGVHIGVLAVERDGRARSPYRSGTTTSRAATSWSGSIAAP
ncbi:MAG: hypothetical protein ACRDPR_13450 [Nocardioidaceae bacterium]